MTNLNLTSTFGTHIRDWRSHQAGLPLCTLDINNCTYQKINNVLHVVVLDCHIIPREEFYSKSKSSLSEVAFGSHSFSCCCILALMRFNQQSNNSHFPFSICIICYRIAQYITSHNKQG